jgi:NADH-quinone oxidoreductase subunit J
MQTYYTLNLFILVTLVAAGLWTVMTRSLIRSAIGLALTSVILTLLMFRFDSWLVAVFELSVCAGLISVIFISTISLTEPLTKSEVLKHMKARLARFIYLPLLILVVGVGLSFIKVNLSFQLPAAEIEADARKVLWNMRDLDLLGQVVIIMTGIFGVIVLFREMRRK